MQASHFPGKLMCSNDNDLLLCSHPWEGKCWISNRFVQNALWRKTQGTEKHSPGLCSSALWNSNGNVWVTDEAAPKITSLISGQNRGLSLPLWLTQHTECPAAPEYFALLEFLIPFLFKVVKLFSFNQANSLEAGGKLCLPRRKILFWGSWFYHVTITPLLSRLFFLLNTHAHHMPNDLQFKKNTHNAFCTARQYPAQMHP